MSDKRVIAGVIVGAAALAVLGYLMTDKGKAKRKKFFNKAHGIVDRLHDRVDDLERSARRSAQHLADRGSQYKDKAQTQAERWTREAKS